MLLNTQHESSTSEPNIISIKEEHGKNEECNNNKKQKKEASLNLQDPITRIDVKFKNTSMGEYSIDDTMFNMLSLHNIRCSSESPLAIGTLVPLGPS